MYFISDIKKMLSSRIVQITFIFLLVTMLADPISVLIHARRYTGFFENIGANPFQFWLLMNSASWGNKVYNILFWVIPVLATGMIYYNEQSSSMSKFLVVRKSKLRYMLSKVISVFSFTLHLIIRKILNLSATTPIKYSQGRLLQNDVKQKPTQDAATDDGCCTLHFCFRYCQYPRL